MRVEETVLSGLLILEAVPISDERGFFARVWDRAELEARGLTADLSQCSVAYNHIRGTLRGLHYQVDPFAEAKTVRCTAGAIFDVAVDLRPRSATRYDWVGVELSAANRRGIYIPEGFAHGYVTLTDEAEVLYQMSAGFQPEASRGVRWDDPTLGIEWPVEVHRISDRDASLPILTQG